MRTWSPILPQESDPTNPSSPAGKRRTCHQTPDKPVIPRGEATHVPPDTGITKEQLKAQLFIHPEECIDCGACESVCPVTAIFPEANVPDKWQDFTKLNYAAFGVKK